jgi:hypothetical protein
MNQDFPSSNKRMKKSITHPGESLFSSLNDNVIEIMETWRVNSTGNKPSSVGSQTSVMLIELIAIS